MFPLLRRIFPLAAFGLLAAAVVWAVSFNTLPPADFSFVNGQEIKSVDPSKIDGAPEGRIVNELFEGLYRMAPDPDEPTRLTPQPAMAVGHTLSADQRTYTFKMRPGAIWDNGDPVTAHDFVWSWRRTLHPETASRYSYQLYYIAGAQKYNTGDVGAGDRVEIELADRPDSMQSFPRGTILVGQLKRILKPSEPSLAPDDSDDKKKKARAQWRKRWVYEVEIKPPFDGVFAKQSRPARGPNEARRDSVQPDDVYWARDGALRRFTQSETVVAESARGEKRIEHCHQVLPHFESVAQVKAVDDATLTVTLDHPTPYFLDLVAFYPLYPVNRRCVEEHGFPQWTKVRNIVGNGPYRLKLRRLRDRIRLEKSETYWDADSVSIETIDALAVTSETTMLNMYLNGQIDWAITVPVSVIPQLKVRDDWRSAPFLTTYFFRLNVNRPPLDNPLVRQALNLATDKRQITEYVTRAGQQPARSIVPPGIPDYEPAYCGEYDPEKARELLAKAGYPNGRGFRKIELLINDLEGHRTIAEVIERQWRTNLGIQVEIRQLEWNSYQATTNNMEYDVARAGWIGDYPDPNTFLDMWVTDGPNNSTGFASKEYDDLIARAATITDRAQRMQTLHRAERILMDAQPIIPIYYYVSVNLVRPYVSGFHSNIQDVHPLSRLRIDEAQRRAMREAEKTQGGPR